MQMASLTTDAKSKDTKGVGLGLVDPFKIAKIGAHLGPKKESAVNSFLRANANAFADQAGAPPIRARRPLGFYL